MGEHVIKQADLFVTEAFRVAEKKVSDTSENFGPPIARAGDQNILELFNDGGSLRHFLSWAGSFLPPSTVAWGAPKRDRGTLSTARKA